jgi:hypothetical protein
MNMKKLNIAVLLVTACIMQITSADEYQLLEGDERTACEVILCLAAGETPSECLPPLREYFNIIKKTPSKTIKARLNFLKLCPNADGYDMPESDYELLASLGGACSGEGKENYIAGYGSQYEYGDGNTANCTWSLQENKFTGSYGGSQCVSTVPLRTRINYVENMCQEFDERFNVITEYETETHYVSVKRCSLINQSQDDARLVCTESLYRSDDPTIPQAQPMPSNCRGWGNTSNCQSVEIL